MASWLGSGAGLVMIGLASIFMAFVGDMPRAIYAWVMRAAIVLMFMGGSTLAVTVVGQFASRTLRSLVNWSGGVGVAVSVCCAVFLLFAVFFGTWKRPSSSIATFAAILPIVLGIFTAGALHSVDKSTTVPARRESRQIDTWLHRSGTGGK
jgi:hypothetical protein